MDRHGLFFFFHIFVHTKAENMQCGIGARKFFLPVQFSVKVSAVTIVC